ncbi:ribosomal protein S18-alanine N-acetyltransferase [Actinomarinicola tropica]|uniref:Ribosomal-protein-alanine N-acetyltransferase n=1 Tax=Actinomarinicola tropica TaxID=2789776 RepID=A0A5Q2RL45_9ACTN|nr:ribosomal protein S18-alanine N-acetyltransferase [Actinomarinicola tropica]QGG93905.1 ribosomal-protein-alanine N-acetyltransferase [Actinomarinicola tropica]
MSVASPTRTTTVRIAPMRRRHLRAVLRTEAQVYPRPWTLGLYLGELALPEEQRIYLVARSGGEVVGHAGLMFATTDGHVTTIAVDPSWQRRGIGAHLLLVLAREAIAKGAQDLTLEVRASNHGAQAMYRRFGFHDAGVRHGYYQEDGEDALIMWANDVAQPAYAERLAGLEAEIARPGLVVVDDVHDGVRIGARR